MHDTGRMARLPYLVEHVGEQRELPRRRHLVALGRGEVGPQPLEREPRPDHPVDERATTSPGGHTPMRCIPVSTFTCTPIGDDVVRATAAMRSSPPSSTTWG